jgi:Recombination endonuclease VII
MKTCPFCKNEYPLTEFYTRKKSPDGKDTYCKPCKRGMVDNRKSANPDHVRKKNRELYHSKPDHFKNTRLKYKYGITLEEFQAICVAQNNICAICGDDGPLVVDHDHVTGKVRGALCHQCNRCLGLLKDNIEILRRSIDYLNAVV